MKKCIPLSYWLLIVSFRSKILNQNLKFFENDVLFENFNGFSELFREIETQI